MRRRVHAAALTTALAAGGCGASASHSAISTSAAPSAPTAGASGPDSCSVVSRAEAAKSLGEPVRSPVHGHASVEGGTACVFYGSEVPPGTNPDAPVRHSVRLVLVTGPEARRFFEDYRGRVRSQTVPGLGNEAYYDGFASVSILKDDRYLRVAVIGPSNLVDAEKQLARVALARL